MIGIIGQGVSGLTAAKYLAEAGFQVTIVAPAAPVEAASYQAQGVVCSKGLTAADSGLFAAKLAGQKILRENITRFQSLPSNHSLAIQSGVYEPFLHDEDQERIMKRVYRGSDFSKFGTQLLTSKEARDKLASEVINVERIKGAFFYPNDFGFDPRAYLLALKTEVERLGVNFLEKNVEEIKLRKGFHLILQDGESIAFDDIVLAAGYSSNRFLSALNLQNMLLKPSEGAALGIDKKQKSPTFACVRGTASFLASESCYFLGATSSPSDRRQTDSAYVRTLLEKFDDAIRLGGSSAVKVLWGVRARTRDRMPLVGKVDIPQDGRRLFLMVGMYKSGFQLADLCARKLVRDFMGEETEDMTAEFDPERLLKRNISGDE